MASAGDPVQRLYFGRDDAEQDMAVGWLREGFRSTAPYEAVLSGRKLLVIGRKGAGKSAICLRLMSGGDDVGSSVLITPDNAAGEEIRRFELLGLTGDTAKSLVWRYVFAVHAARYLMAHADAEHGRHRRTALKALRKFLQANNEWDEAGLYDRLVRGANRLQSTSLSLEAFGVKAGLDMSRSSEGARASAQLEVLEAGVARAFGELGCAERHGPLLVLVDQLEQIWSNDPESKAMVTGLLLAGKRAASVYGSGLRCVLFLRADIYDVLEFSDGDKFRGDEIRIKWSIEELKALALTRASLSLGRELTAAELWGQVLPGRVCGVPAAEYVFSRSLPRPRDAIQFLNLCRDEAAEQGHAAITSGDVMRAAQQFSEWKLQDVAREYLINFPFLSQVFAIFRNTGYVVMRTALENRFVQNRAALHERFPEYTEALTAEGVVDVLFGINFLGVRRGSDIVYAGDAGVPVQPHESEFHIHPCFRLALNADNSTELHPYVPLQPLNIRNAVQGQIVGAVVQVERRRDFRLVESLIDSCRRIQRQIARSSLPEQTAYEISVQVGNVMEDATRLVDRMRAGAGADAESHVVAAMAYLRNVATQLITNGVDIDGEVSTTSVVRRIREEARVINRVMGGGGSGGI
ncbi:hypothetical protein ABZ468_51450 [Streptomyces sp. NPDC005708]|uniref:P-loop ATPase, Sll1717 family n=1 Tax=Streptomyces sp. NPDC005708 TaxID=3154564 RepID=UPI0033E20CBE